MKIELMWQFKLSPIHNGNNVRSVFDQSDLNRKTNDKNSSETWDWLYRLADASQSETEKKLWKWAFYLFIVDTDYMSFVSEFMFARYHTLSLLWQQSWNSA